MINKTKDWAIVSYATTLPNVLSVFNITNGEIAHLQKLPPPGEHWKCHACDEILSPNGDKYNELNTPATCKHYIWLVEVGQPVYSAFDGQNWWFSSNAAHAFVAGTFQRERIKLEYDPWHEVGKMIGGLLNVVNSQLTHLPNQKLAKEHLNRVERALDGLTQWRLRQR